METDRTNSPRSLGPRHAIILLMIWLTSGSIAVADRSPDGHGGGSRFSGVHPPHLTVKQRIAIKRELRANKRDLEILGLLPALREQQPAAESSPLLSTWPVKAVPSVTDFNVDGVSNFVDHEPASPDFLLDYNCGERTYDLASGYNHRGLDIFTWPFSWNRMDNDEVSVVAAAPGVILHKSDGNYDRNCGFGGGDWNAVYVIHADGSTAWYGHLKSGSLTPKGVGAAVSAGEYLGIVGSSGNSTGPHLHLELYDADDNLVDPYAGTCNSLNSASWWTNQPQYYESQVNKLMTGWASSIYGACSEPEIPNERTTFIPGEAVYFTTFYRDQRAGQVSQYAIYQPDGTPWYSWSDSSSEPHYAASWWYWWWSVFAPEGPEGVWQFVVDYEGKQYESPFYLVPDCPLTNQIVAQTVATSKTFAAQETLVVEPDVEVASNGSLTLLTGSSVAISGGFSLASGASLRVISSSDVCAI